MKINIGFTTGEVHKITRVSKRQIRWWDQQGLLSRYNSLNIRWKRRFFNLQDIICVLVIKTLRDNGISLQKIRESVYSIRVAGVESPLAKLRVACLAHAIVFKKDGKFYDPLSGQLVIAEALEIIRPHYEPKIINSVQRAIQRANKHFEEKMANF